ncbi:MAG: acyltransferase [Alphaproteobacteria bacterium]|nr:acyltransferase [Alphaproteobacteria bacterium]
MIYKNVQALRALAANGVLLSHILSVEQKYGAGFTVLSGNVHFGAIGVDLFFVISGFIMAALANNATWDKFLINRATRIYPPYWFYTTIVLIVSLIAPSMVNSSYDHAPSLWKSYLLIPDTVMPLLAVGWTLIHEMYFYLVFAFILFASRAVKLPLIAWIGVWAIEIITFNLSSTVTFTQPILLLITHPFTLEFILGVCVGMIIRERAFVQISFIIGCIILFISALYIPPAFTFDIDVKDLRHVCLFGIPCALLVLMALKLEMKTIFISPNWLVELGNASYSTYLAHVLVISAIGRVFLALPYHSTFYEILFVLVCMVAPNMVGLFSYRFIELPMQSRLRTAITKLRQ